MPKTITVTADNEISEAERAKKLQYLQNELTDEQLDKLYQLAQKPSARKKLVEKFNIIKTLL